MVNSYKLVALPHDYKDLILQKRNVQCGKNVSLKRNKRMCQYFFYPLYKFIEAFI